MVCNLTFATAPYRLSGTVYGTLLNHQSARAAMADQFAAAPYKGAPRAPVLYVKPRNTRNVDGGIVEVPDGTPELEAAACLGIVIGRTACRVPQAQALDYVAGYLLVNDVSVPHPNYYRPSVRYKARDGFCPLGPRVTPRSNVPDPDALTIRTYVDGALVQTMNTADLERSVARLLCDVTEFMTLAPGDVLAAGAAAPAPRVHAGQTVTIECDGLGVLGNRFAVPA